MLVLTRQVESSLILKNEDTSEEIEVKITSLSATRAGIGITAAGAWRIRRSECDPDEQPVSESRIQWLRHACRATQIVKEHPDLWRDILALAPNGDVLKMLTVDFPDAVKIMQEAAGRNNFFLDPYTGKYTSSPAPEWETGSVIPMPTSSDVYACIEKLAESLAYSDRELSAYLANRGACELRDLSAEEADELHSKLKKVQSSFSGEIVPLESAGAEGA